MSAGVEVPLAEDSPDGRFWNRDGGLGHAGPLRAQACSE